MSSNRVPLQALILVHVALRPLSPIRQKHKNSKEPYYRSSALDTCNLQSTHQLMSCSPFFFNFRQTPLRPECPTPGVCASVPTADASKFVQRDSRSKCSFTENQLSKIIV